MGKIENLCTGWWNAHEGVAIPVLIFTSEGLAIMNKIVLTVCMTLALAASLEAGTLTGRILRENGTSLSATTITIQGIEVTTNQFGGYEVNLPDGSQELVVMVEGKTYRTDTLRIYSPQTKQNWRLNPASQRLEKIL